MTQRLQIAIVISAALPLGYDVIHVARWRDEAYALALNTHRMYSQKSQPQSTPMNIVATLGSRFTLTVELVLFVPTMHWAELFTADHLSACWIVAGMA